MSVISYLPSSDNDRVTWFNNFGQKIVIHGPVIGLSPAEITSVQNDVAFFQYIINLKEIHKQTLKNIVGYVRLLKKASGQQHLSTTVPALPTLGTAPPSVPEGIFDRVSKLVARIKSSLNYTDNMGSDLGIISPSSNFDPLTMQPELKVNLDAGRPHVKWIKGESDALDLYADHNDGAGFVLVGRFMRNEYIDAASVAANKLLDEWSYKGIYVIADQPVGLFSGIVDIGVKRI